MRAGVLLTPDEAKVWRQNRALLVAASHPDNRCRCGEKKMCRDKRSGRVEAVCVKYKLWNFWKHDPPRVVLHY